MVRISLIGAAFALGILASPAAAQQTSPEAPAPIQRVGSGEPLPPSEQSQPSSMSQAEPLPPPFPHYPKARPSHRTVDVGGGHSSSRAHHRATVSSHHEARSHQHASRTHSKSKATHSRTTRSTGKAAHRCDRMTYKQILKSSSCRSQMKKEIAAAERPHHRASHVKATKHKSTHTRPTTRQRHHSSKRKSK
jgi:hypothetical protein